MNWIQKIAIKIFGIKIPTVLTHYQEMVIRFSLEKAELGKVVLVGDSITEAWASTTLLPNTTLNYGIAADDTIGVLGRVEQIVKARPSKVLLNIGANDIFVSKSPSMIDNYAKIVDRLIQEVGQQNVICCAVRPMNLTFTATAQVPNNSAIRNFNELIKTICYTRGCVFEPDTYSIHIVPAQPDEMMRATHTTDGIHLSPIGYAAEYEIIKKYL
jgi:lysophospholipase L1-like esterase